MKKQFVVFLLALGIAMPVEAVEFGGVEFPDGAASFADAVIDYNPGYGVTSPYDIPSNAVGTPDNAGVSLGWGGSVILRFIDNSLTTSGDAESDLWIFEIGPMAEDTSVYISTDGANWLSVGKVGGSTSGIDIDAYSASGVVAGEQYSYVKVTDLDRRMSSYPYAGADIDAVGAISSAPPIPEPSTMFLLGSGLLGLMFHRRKK